jgi:formate-dependent nitrite reductase membrane component NrfD
MNFPMVCRIFGITADERFLEHRRRSTSLAGIISALVAISIFEYHLLHDHIWRWDLLAVALTFAVIKLSMMAWYRITA